MVITVRYQNDIYIYIYIYIYIEIDLKCKIVNMTLINNKMLYYITFVNIYKCILHN